MLSPKGIIPALVTPFNKNDQIDKEALKKLVNRAIDGGCDGLFCLGSNGEFASLNNSEKVEVARIVVEEAKGKVPVYAGTGTNSTTETIRLTNEMERIGVDAVSVITPYYVTLSQEELTAHFRMIAEQTNLPIILYNIPRITGNTIQPETVKELGTIDSIVAIKDSSGNLDFTIKLIEIKNSDFQVLIGTDSLILPGLMAGADGAIAATANYMPRVVANIYTYWRQGKYEEANENQNKLKVLRSAFSLGTMPSVLKAAINQSGLDVGIPRLPVQPLPEDVKIELKQLLSAYKSEELV
ncbi:4-hydroxy-tetrahydrodipicolinate synthase [Evansella halocellulosilytica]|uniref:4-hydroxy-tetrahydrodipicolinate synthase n=1 Tax=Evansella halocellulosilytica TaxID=2011013 RepID=UPI000BB82748|nr:4-hydroxy-tetrahydrodipicolinate synthase [Evansella halocellulosilytica]